MVVSMCLREIEGRRERLRNGFLEMDGNARERKNEKGKV